jgi:integrase/recombinase XerD
MKYTKLYIRFFAVEIKTNSKGTCPIYCKISYSKKSKQFSTGIFIKPMDWNKEAQIIESTDVNHITKNGLLQTITSKLLKIELELHLDDELISLDIVYNRYNKQPNNESYGICEYYNTYVQKIKKLIGKDITLSTWKKFKYINKHLEEFIKFKYGKDQPLATLKSNFIEDFEYWLKVEKDQKQITINKSLQRFRKPIRIAVKEEIITRDPFIDYKVKGVKSNVVFLTNEELNYFEKTPIKQTRLEKIRQLFIFCCYTGLAYAEMTSLRLSNIQKGFDGKDWIVITRLKTGKEISIPLLPKAEKIMKELNFYENGSLPKISNQKFNSYVKEIGFLFEIDKRLTHHTARKTFASTVLLFNGVPMEIVKELLGHSSITTTEQSYGKVLNKQISQQVAKLYHIP